MAVFIRLETVALEQHHQFQEHQQLMLAVVAVMPTPLSAQAGLWVTAEQEAVALVVKTELQTQAVVLVEQEQAVQELLFCAMQTLFLPHHQQQEVQQLQHQADTEFINTQEQGA